MNDKKIIVGINASFARKPYTGIGQVTLNFLKKLSQFKVDKFNFILYLEEDLSRDFELPKNFKKRIFLPFWKRDDLIRKIWWEKCLLPRYAKKDKCSYLISPYQCPTIVSSEIKHLMITHDVIPELFPEYLNNFRKKLYWKLTKEGIKNADKIISISSRTEKDLIRHLGISPEKISINYIDADEIFKKYISDGKKQRVLSRYKLKPGYILAGGGYEARKNVAGVIRAYKILRDKNKKEYFTDEFPVLAIYGKLMPELAPLITDAEKLARELNLTQRIKFLNLVPQKDLPVLFSSAIMFVFPSFYEGFGLPVLEAMNTGTPVIAGKISSLPEVGLDSALYCHPNDPSDIAMVMKNLMVKKKLRDDLTRRGLERAKQFSWQKFTEKILNIIENIV